MCLGRRECTNMNRRELAHSQNISNNLGYVRVKMKEHYCFMFVRWVA